MTTATRKEELLKRALDTATETALQKEDLSELITLLTPKDTPLVQRLGRTVARAVTHEWNESSANATLTHGNYTESDIPSDTKDTYTRRNNIVMQLGKVAKVSGLFQRVAVVQGYPDQVADAMANEISMKMMDLMRTLEYYAWRGDNTTPTEMDGVIATVTTNTLSLGNTAITEADIQEMLATLYGNGSSPTAIFCRPNVAVTIANFAKDRVNFNLTPGQKGDFVAGQAVMRYLSPFGTVLDVVPVRTDFLPSGSVYILDESKIKFAVLTENLIDMEEIQTGKDNIARLLKSYVTLELRAETYHGLINQVNESL